MHPTIVPDGCTAAKTFTTINGAVNQLKTDQSTADFTATQTIRVYNGTYTGEQYMVTLSGGGGILLHPTATYRLIVEAAPGNSPVIDCAGAANSQGVYDLTGYVTVAGFEITNCTFGMGTANVPGVIIHHNSIHDCTYAVSIGGPSFTAYENRIDNCGVGIASAGAAATGSLIYRNEISHLTAASNASGIMVRDGSTVEDNIVYNCNKAGGGSGVYASGTGTPGAIVRNNVVYTCRYGTQAQNSVGSGGVDFHHNITVGNRYNIILEGGFGAISHATTYRGDPGIYEEGTGSFTPATSTSLQSSLIWPAGGSRGPGASKLDQIITYDYNDYYMPGGGIIAVIGNTVYYSLADWQSATGLDAHTISVDPQFVGDPELLMTTEQICPACTFDERLAYIRNQYAPQNRLLKGTAQDGGDIGAVPWVDLNPTSRHMLSQVTDLHQTTIPKKHTR